MRLKNNVNVFNQDVSDMAGYRYSDSSVSISKLFSNSRTSSAIEAATNWRGKKVIDIGCGDGAFTTEFAAFGVASVMGVDPADQAIEIARHRAARDGVSDRVAFRAESVYALPDLGARYDVAVLRGVLHHLPDQQRAVQAVAAVADEIVILEPNGFNPVLKVIERVSPYHRAHEEQSFIPSTIDTWLRRSGKKPTGGRLINLVPLFCPDGAARVLKALEPVVEAIPVVRLIGCGQYIVKGV